MNWDDVRIFLAVARAGQILGAAKRLGVNHATVARRLTALEDDINTKLLTRRTNGCELTHAGEEFLLSAERMEAEMLSARSALGDADVSISGSVRIGAPDGFGVSFLAPRIATLTARYPDLKIQLVPVPRSFSLSRREADIAITVDRPDQGRLVAKKLVDYTLCLYASRSYLAAHPAPRTVEDLSGHRLVGYVDDLVISPSLNYAPEITRDWRPTFEISSAIGQVEAVKAGAGIGILHTFIAREHPDLVPVLPERTIQRSYWLAYHESVRTLRRITAVSSFISDLVNAETGRFT
ncbi:LysR family transcriptional regulator [Phyllobacterium myrsinacearum]|uniref:DNA-binding transcriptional LysR family regulator n=1 Tax=Phyllobacterium myrsinacearum TaxID=28101 RepID=A0A839EKU8_9HYPH|nr:LysR family transcriptional regulator [Phyllobacterium myrsinacearum]MBA8878116.1 DNA-binding transcriptional LysR family regulator [Phyllobacterium myrsinacearum]